MIILIQASVTNRERSMRKRVLLLFPVISLEITNQGEDSNFTVEKSGRYHFSQVIKINITSSGINMFLLTLLHCWWECTLIQPLWRTVWRFLKKLRIELPYDPAIPLLGIYPEKTIIQKELCTTVFTAALFTVARTWK